MAKRLVKIAKELNVGTSTIVEYLSTNGYTVENKPTAKIEDDMYALLLKEFSNSMEEKEKADKLIIGTRLPQEEEKPVKAPPVVETPEPAKIVEETIPEVPEPVEIPEKEEKVKEEVIRAESPKLGVQGC